MPERRYDSNAIRQAIKNLSQSTRRQEYLELMNNADFAKDDLDLMEYPQNLGRSDIPNYLRSRGLKFIHPQVPHIVTSLAPNTINKGGDIASQLWDTAIGSLSNPPSQ